jgi:hypothetical protein
MTANRKSKRARKRHVRGPAVRCARDATGRGTGKARRSRLGGERAGKGGRRRGEGG